MKALHVDAGWDDIDTEKILDSCKGVITVFTVVQATANNSWKVNLVVQL